MVNIILSKEKTSKTIGLDNIMYFFLFLYLCAISAHKTGEGFDSVFVIATFICFFGLWALNIMIGRYKLIVNNYMVWLFFFIGFAFLSILWAANSNESLRLTKTFFQIFLTGLTFISIIRDNNDLEHILKLIWLSLIYSSIVLLVKTPFSEFGTERIGTAIGLHSNTLGFRLATGILLSIYFATKKNKFRPIYILSALGFAMLILFTGSRKSFLMIIIYMVSFIILYKQKDLSVKGTLKKFLLFIFIIVALMFLWYLMMSVEVFYNILGHRIEAMINDFLGNSTDASMVGRDYFAEKAVELFKQNPIIGYGLNNFSVYMREINYANATYSHNNLLELLSTLGIIGTSIFYIPIVVMLINTFRFYHLNKDFNLGIVLFIFVAFNVVVSSYNMFYNSEFFYIFVVCSYMYYSLQRKVNINEQIKKSHECTKKGSR